MRRRRFGLIQRKILLLLSAGVALGLSKSLRHHIRTLRLLGDEWKKLERENLWRSIHRLYAARMIEEKHEADGSVRLVLSQEGTREVLRFNLDRMRILKQPRWDAKWRIVTFDIPESKKAARDALRMRLTQIGMKEYQKSIFVSPYPCDKEIEFLVEFFDLRSHVRRILAESLDNGLHYRQKFCI